ncbi:MAG: AzlD domain-containing protein [Oscillospiraceae bacterium]|nr:AzlD domain-containing protein [Oscillospiraceae bacterium]
MKTSYLLAATLVMAGVTYLLRMLPLALVKGKIRSPFIRSFLAYVPYAVLAAMTFPDILSSTASLLSAAVGLAAALVLSCRGKSLIVVALGASGAVWAAERLLAVFSIL